MAAGDKARAAAEELRESAVARFANGPAMNMMVSALLAELPGIDKPDEEWVDDCNAGWADSWVKRAASVLREISRITGGETAEARNRALLEPVLDSGQGACTRSRAGCLDLGPWRPFYKAYVCDRCVGQDQSDLLAGQSPPGLFRKIFDCDRCGQPVVEEKLPGIGYVCAQCLIPEDAG